LPSSTGNSRPLRLAAIDIGTNSVHLIVADVDRRTGKFRVVDREREHVRLGSGPSDMKALDPGAMARGIQTVRRFKEIADASRAPVRAIATSAVREAANRKEFIAKVERQTGVRIEIASGYEEARLIYLGVLQALPVFRKRVLLLDIGGGSTEFLVGRERDIQYVNSLKMGALRLASQFFPSGVVTKKAVEQCRRHVAGMLSPVVREVRKLSFEACVGTSGTITAAATITREMRGEPDLQMNGFTFSSGELDDVVDAVLGARTVEERTLIAGLDERRADIIVPGVIILQEVFRALRVREMALSEYALREGIILDTFEKRSRKHGIHLHDIRFNSILHLAENFHVEDAHARQVTDLAVKLFDQTRRIHGLGAVEREYLEAAGLLHEVGLYLSHSQHHLHSYYLIRNAELVGFTENEKEIIANIARYHRKSHPRSKHENFSLLDEDDRGAVLKLAALLRIADGLDRGHSAAVRDLRFRRRGEKAVCEVVPAPRQKADLELWGADRKKQLFEEEFGLELSFVVK
jgi:exopolyphosphatase/guanosine-5'-triphosphate,3'-diphosphate pyrophosphatase